MRIFFISLVISEVLWIAYAIISGYLYGLPPAPLAAYFPSDTFMDFYNTNYHAFSDLKYTGWASIYPPFVFVVGQILTKSQCVGLLPLQLRDCDTYSVFLIFVSQFISCIYSAKIMMKFCSNLKPAIGVLVAIGFFFSMPSLFAIERGNYITLSLMFLSIAIYYGSGVFFILCAVLAISIKQYIGLLFIFLLIFNRGREFVCIVLGVCIVNLISVIYLNDHNWHLVFQNMLGFANGIHFSHFEKMWFPTSLNAYNKIIDSNYFITRYYEYSTSLKSATFSLMIIAFVFTIIIFYKVKKHNSLQDEDKQKLLIFSLLLLMLFEIDSLGGYALVYLFPFISVLFNENFKKTSKAIYYSSCFLLFSLMTPLDIELFPTRIISDNSYLYDNYVISKTALTFGSYYRPVAIFALVFLLWLDCVKKGAYDKD